MLFGWMWKISTLLVSFISLHQWQRPQKYTFYISGGARAPSPPQFLVPYQCWLGISGFMPFFSLNFIFILHAFLASLKIIATFYFWKSRFLSPTSHACSFPPLLNSALFRAFQSIGNIYFVASTSINHAAEAYIETFATQKFWDTPKGCASICSTILGMGHNF